MCDINITHSPIIISERELSAVKAYRVTCRDVVKSHGGKSKSKSESSSSKSKLIKVNFEIYIADRKATTCI